MGEEGEIRGAALGQGVPAVLWPEWRKVRAGEPGKEVREWVQWPRKGGEVADRIAPG